MKQLGILALAVLLLFGAAPLGAQQAKKQPKYAGATKCRSCHKKEPIGNQYGAWLDSKHAKALESLATDQAKEWAAEAGVADPQTDEQCVKCHVTAHGVPKERLGLKFKASEVVLPDEKVCVVCHNDESPAWDPERYTRADGTKTGFDYDEAAKLIAHPVPEGYDPMAEGEAD
jgi:YD repeat-containing protein